MTPEEKYELFEKHCSQELSINEKARLDKLIKDDVVKKELQVYKELHVHLDTNFNTENQKAALAKNLKKVGDSYFAKKLAEKETKQEVKKEIKHGVKEEIFEEPVKKSKVIKLPSWAYAIAASVAIVFGVYFFSQGNPTYNNFVSIPELSITERGSAEESIKNAETAFNTKNYAKAEEYLTELLSEDEKNAEYQFYYGISLLEQDKYAKASRAFTKLQQGNSAYKYKALWFEALNKLKQKNYDQCAALLHKLPKEAEDYDQAQKLLEKLD
ncbi:hypothetical protein [Aquimarina sp. MMG016]|uniref:tetratricopeptide repeat protein n=1 Tax=Aquimarina sp. MMG016 TaxID=2822690 RepID=UPI001B3A1C90|nr:hypothetical protein [Aquimarina sp. MMG016]MBQ4818771.1 hypothetical protein [Aquimarina sp. MMG016]